MLDQLAIVRHRQAQFAIIRKHALAEWRASRAEGRPFDTHRVEMEAHDEIVAAFPLILVLTILQVGYYVYWLVVLLWPKHEPTDSDENDIEAMGSMGI